MSEAFVRTAYDGGLCFQVTAPANSGAYAQIASLLSGPQLAELAGKTVVAVALFTPSVAINYKHGSVAGVVSPNGAPTAVNANQKPNEWIPATNGHQTIYVQSNTAGTATVSVVLYYVNSESV
jgi:hypothetical protein